VLICIPQLLPKALADQCRERLLQTEWVDGAVTAGDQSRLAKKNRQVPESSPVARELGELVLDALSASSLFISAALPLKTFPPLFNRYGVGDGFGAHIDNAIRPVLGTPVRLRTDLSATLFLSEPSDYDGGELVIEGQYGAQEVKLEAGDLVLYPASSLHRVNPITRGERIASFFWIQSMVRSEQDRANLFDLDQAIQDHAREHGQDHPRTIVLTGVYHNLVRRWAQT
jgi:PKHD-type hydroxylase